MWTLDEIEDLSSKVAVVTNNAKVILCSRSIEKGEKARSEILAEIGDKDIVVEQLDLSDFQSISDFAHRFNQSYDRLDILVNNAGIMASPFVWTKDHLEQQIGVNHFGHFALTARLFRIIRNTSQARIVNVSSLAHKNGTIDFRDLFFEKRKYQAWKAYSQSKLANLLFTYELQNKCDKYQIDIKVIAAHPGVSQTNLGRYIEKNKIAKVGYKALTQPASMGALPIIYAACAKDVVKGGYYGPDGLFEMKGQPTLVSSSKKSHDKVSMKRLFDLSENICNVKFDFSQD